MASFNNYKPGIRKIINVIQPKFEISRPALQIIDKILNELNVCLIEECRKKFKSRSRDAVLKLPVAVNVVSQVFQGSMKNHAIAEGNRSVLLYNSGILQYVPKKVVRRIKKPQKSKSKLGAIRHKLGTSYYAKGIVSLCKIIPETTVHSGGKQMLANMLEMLSMRISNDAKVMSQKAKNIDVQNIRSTIENVLPENIRAHALAEGAKMVMFFESGMIPFQPTLKRTRRKDMRNHEITELPGTDEEYHMGL